jgi:hydroxypyruvate reductase
MIIISPDLFRSTPQPEQVATLLQSTLNRADPYQAVLDYLQKNSKDLALGSMETSPNSFSHLRVLSIGKAALPMTKAAVDQFGKMITDGMVVYKNPDPSIALPNEIQLVKGDHPIPGENSLKAGRMVIQFLEKIEEFDFLLVLLSGGGSALLIAPTEGISLASLQDLTQKLIASGATIQEMNIIRRHLDLLKGGGVIKRAHGARTLSLVISDVIGNELSSVASGVTTFDVSTFEEAVKVLQKYKLDQSIDPSIWKYLNAGKQGLFEETIKPGDQRLENTQIQLILSNPDSIKSGEQTARKIGWEVVPVKNLYTGEAKEVGTQLAEFLSKMAKARKKSFKPTVAIFGGEPTVHVTGTGKGGRNLELGLSAVDILDGVEDVALISFSTDGEDGPTDAAGVIVTGKTAEIAKQNGLSVKAFLAENDSYHFFEKVGGLIKTGPTGTNVNDLVFLIAF